MALRPRRGMWVYGPAAYTPVDAASELAWHALPGPGSAREADSPYPPADLAEITRLYGLRHWVEQSYIQVEDELGWADFQVRSDLAIRRHQILVCCAFSFCWAHWLTHPPPERAPSPLTGPTPERGGAATRYATKTLLAQGDPRGPRLADSLAHATTLLGSVVTC